jgi:dTDP-D-glucose 4,6-dehydratase
VIGSALYSGKPINKFGDGTTSRDYTFVSDIVQVGDYKLSQQKSSTLADNFRFLAGHCGHDRHALR